MSAPVITSELDKALALVGLGFRVVACRAEAEGKAPRKSPYGGPYAFEGDANGVRELWKRHPNALAGIAPGEGYVVVDVDVKHGGDGFQALADLGHELPATYSYTTPSGGAHYIYRTDGNVGNLRFPSVEVQGDGTVAVFYGDVPTPSDIAPAPAWAVSEKRPTAAPATSEEVELFMSRLGDRTLTASVARAIEEATAMDGDHPTLMTKVWHVMRAVIGHPDWRQGWYPSAGREAFEVLASALEGPYSAKYDEWDRQWAEALGKVVASVSAEFAEFEAEMDERERAYLSRDLDAEYAALVADMAGWEPVIEETVIQEAPRTDAVFRIVSRSELRNRPKAEWIVEGLVQGAGVVTLAATGGVGKTFLALDWAASMATGRDWQGRKVRAGRTLFVAAEGIDYFEDRLSAWELYNRAEIPDDRLEYVESGFNFSDAAAVEQMREYVAGRAYDLIVIDTLSQLSAVDSENDASEMAAVYRAARSIREANPGSTVLVVHHLNKGGGLRGSSVIRDNSDAVIIGQPSASGFTLSTLVEDDGKQKNGASERLTGFHLTEFGPSLVITRDENVWSGADALDKAIEEVFNGKDGGPVKISHILAKLGDKSDAMRKRVQRKLQDDPTVTSEGSTTNRVYHRELD